MTSESSSSRAQPGVSLVSDTPTGRLVTQARRRAQCHAVTRRDTGGDRDLSESPGVTTVIVTGGPGPGTLAPY